MVLATKIYQERRAKIAEMRERERKDAEEALKYYVPGVGRQTEEEDPEPETFDPSSRSLIYWFKANELTGSEDDKIGTLTDSSGGAHHFNVQDVSRRASLRLAHQNGLNVAEFVGNGGNGSWYVGPENLFTAAATGATMYAVLRNATESADNLFHDFDGNTGNSNHFPFSDGNIYDGFGSTVRKTVGNPAASMVAYRLYDWLSQANDWKFFIDAVEFFSTGTNTFAFAADQNNLGRAATGWLGHVAEIIVTDVYDSVEQRQKMEGYLAHKWFGAGASNNLPADHPYRNSPPTV